MASEGIYFKSSKGSINRPFVFVVEGIDDAHFLDAILLELNAPPDKVGTLYIKGKDKLDENLNILLKHQAFVDGTIKRYAIIRDCDDSAQQSLNEIHAVLKKHNQATPAPNMIAANKDGKEVGIYLIPNSADPGDLERLCLTTILDDPKYMEVEEFYKKIDATYGPFNVPYKRLSQIYLACCNVETRGVGWTYKKGQVFKSNHPCLNDIKAFVNKLIT